jgi:hypothetical protein
MDLIVTLSITTLKWILNVITLSVTFFRYAERCHTERRYAECHSAECRNAECRGYKRLAR